MGRPIRAPGGRPTKRATTTMTAGKNLSMVLHGVCLHLGPDRLRWVGLFETWRDGETDRGSWCLKHLSSLVRQCPCASVGACGHSFERSTCARVLMRVCVLLPVCVDRREGSCLPQRVFVSLHLASVLIVLLCFTTAVRACDRT